MADQSNSHLDKFLRVWRNYLGLTSRLQICQTIGPAIIPLNIILTKYSEEYQKTIGLINMLFNILSFFAIGAMVGFESLGSRAMGQNDLNRLNRMFKLANITLLLTIIPVSYILLGVTVYLEQEIENFPSITYEMIYYARGIIILLYPMFVNSSIWRYFLIRRLLNNTIVSTIIAFIVYFLMIKFSEILWLSSNQSIWPIFLIGLNTATFSIVSTIVAIIYIYYYHLIDNFFKWDFNRIEVIEFIKITIPGIIMVVFDGSFVEIAGLIASKIPSSIDFTNYTIAISLYALSGYFFLSIGFVVTVETGKTIGRGKEQECLDNLRYAILGGVILTGFFLLIDGIIVTMLVPTTLLIGRSEEELEDWFLICPYLVACSGLKVFTYFSTGLIKGSGQQRTLSYFNLINFYLFTLPLLYYLTFYREWGIFGIWTGLTIGLSISVLCQLTILYFIDWGELIRRNIPVASEPSRTEHRIEKAEKEDGDQEASDTLE